MQFAESATIEGPPREAAHRAAKTDEKTGAERIRIEQHSFSGMLWFVGWLFTIGFLQLPFGTAVLALVVWPYYLGRALTGLLP
jgi:hypothetical protein